MSEEVSHQQEEEQDVAAVLDRQKSRGYVSAFRQQQLERQAAANWDRFYKRNETRFFKDRHWPLSEYLQYLPRLERPLVLLEVGCGVGNFLYPLITEQSDVRVFVHACDFSPRAIEFVRQDARYDASLVNAFVCDVTVQPVTSGAVPGAVRAASVDVASLIFVLSSVQPRLHTALLANLTPALRAPGGLLLFRDYGRHDMAQLRFGPGQLLEDNFYVKQDGTRVYYFSVQQVERLFEAAGFSTVCCHYVSRQTVNRKQGVRVKRTFVQGVFKLSPAPVASHST